MPQAEDVKNITEEKSTIDESIFVCAIDMDGCVFNKKFLELLNTKGKHGYELTSDELDEIIEESNPELIKHILEMADRHSKAILMLGSNRQILYTDSGNGFFKKDNKFQTGSATLVMESIHRIVSRKNKSITHDKYLLEDAFLGSDQAQSHENFKKHFESMEQKRIERIERIDRSTLTPYEDPSKVTMVYVQMHRIASQYPNANIRYQLLDDVATEILDPVQLLFNDYPELKPHNILISCLRYGIPENDTRFDAKETYSPPPPPALIKNNLTEEKGFLITEEKHAHTDSIYYTNFREKFNKHFKQENNFSKLHDTERAQLVFSILAERDGQQRDAKEQFEHANRLYAKKWHNAAIGSIREDAQQLLKNLTAVTTDDVTITFATELLHRTNTVLKIDDIGVFSDARHKYKNILASLETRDSSWNAIRKITDDIYRKTFLLEWEYYAKKWNNLQKDNNKNFIAQAAFQLLGSLKEKPLTITQLLETSTLIKNIDGVMINFLSSSSNYLPDLFDLQNKFPPSVQKQIFNIINSIVEANHSYCKIATEDNFSSAEATNESKQNYDDPKAGVVTDSSELRKCALDLTQYLIQHSKETVKHLSDQTSADKKKSTQKNTSENQQDLIKTIKLLHLIQQKLTTPNYKINYSEFTKTINDFSCDRTFAFLRKVLTNTCQMRIQEWKESKNSIALEAVALATKIKIHIEQINNDQLTDADKLLDSINDLIDKPTSKTLYDAIIVSASKLSFIDETNSLINTAFNAACDIHKREYKKIIDTPNNVSVAKNLVDLLITNKKHIKASEIPDVACLLSDLHSYQMALEKSKIVKNLIDHSKTAIHTLQKNNNEINCNIDLDKFKIDLAIDNNDIKSVCQSYCDDWKRKNTPAASAANNLAVYLYKHEGPIPENERLLVVELLHRTNTLIINPTSEVARQRFFNTLNLIYSIENSSILQIQNMDLDALITQITNHNNPKELKNDNPKELKNVLNDYRQKWVEKKGEPDCVKAARDLLDRLQSLEDNKQIPKEEKHLAIELLHRTDTLIRRPTDPLAKSRYAATLQTAKNKTKWGDIIFGSALVVLGVAMIVGAALLATSTFGGGSPLSLFVVKGAITAIVKGLVIGGVVGAGLTGITSLATGAATIKHAAKRSPKFTYLPYAQHFFETKRELPPEDNKQPAPDSSPTPASITRKRSRS